MKIVQVKPFGIFKISDHVKDSMESQSKKSLNDDEMKTLVKDLKKSGSSSFIGILPERNELFTFIPIIEDNQFFVAQFPDPIQLYFSLAYSNFELSQKSRHQITFQKGQKTPFNFINPYLYNWHLQYKISTIIFLHCTIEAFINYLMPEEFIYTQIYKANNSEKFLKQTKEFNKEQTERFILFKEKLTGVIPQLANIDVKKDHQKLYDSLLTLNSMRNDLIHLRSTKDKNQQYFEKVFDNIINVNLNDYVFSVKNFINLIKPGFIEFEEVTQENEPIFTIRFENFGAFKFDISIFLKILEVPQKKVFIVVPKDNIPDFQPTMNWVMQNLDVMAHQQLIYFPSVDDSDEKVISVEIIKTGKILGKV